VQASGLSYTLAIPPAYFDNWGTFFRPNAGPDGKTAFTLPTGGKPWVQCAIGDMGEVLLPVWHDPANYNGKFIELASENLTLNQCVATYNKVYGTNHGANDVPVAVFAKFGFPGAGELAAMFEWYQLVADRRAKNPLNPYPEIGLRASDYILASRENFPHFQTFEAFLTARKASEGAGGAAPAAAH